ncbi:hypothetical protein L6452_34457 [Arctium lappa]|uniref:Uncharacterized protein n=1 Tax=Arctium lappa TaxID=4217 RepID=A0ACB8YIS9_ARCLA|nr:hypothetical protein L6452_34457 [Arctium lappa]
MKRDYPQQNYTYFNGSSSTSAPAGLVVLLLGFRMSPGNPRSGMRNKMPVVLMSCWRFLATKLSRLIWLMSQEQSAKVSDHRKLKNAIANVKVLARTHAPSLIRATTPSGRGCVMIPTIIARNIDSNCQAILETPEGTETNHRITLVTIEAT